MKRFFIFFLVVGIVFMTGCELPVKKSASDITNEYTQGGYDELESEIDESSAVEENDGTTRVKGVNTDVGSEEKQENKKLSIVLYYQSGDGYIIPVTRKVTKQEGIAKATINALIDSSINREELEYFGLYPVLPMGTEIRGLTIKEGVATIDFNNKLLEYSDKIAERNIVSSIVYTLTEFKTVESVKILVDGAEKSKLKYGADISGSLNRKSILVNSDRVMIKQGAKKLDIYLLKNVENQLNYTVPVSVEYPENEDANIPSKVVEYLAKGVKVKELYSEVPQKTKLLKNESAGNVLTLDFNSSIKDYGGGTAREEGLMKQILYSMKQIEGITKVKFLINGKEDNMPEGSDISQEIDIPLEINDYIDNE